MKLPKVNAADDHGRGISKLPGATTPDYAPWLTADSIKARGTTDVQMLGNLRESNSQYGEGIVADVRIGKRDFSMTIKFSSGNYNRLVQKFGTNPAKWRGKFRVQRAVNMGKTYVQVCD